MLRSRPVLLSIMLVVCLLAEGRAQRAERWVFENVDRIDVEGVSGDVFVESVAGDAVTLTLEHDVDPADAFQPEVVQRDGSAVIRERWRGSSSSGWVRWTLGVPAAHALAIDVRTSSGDLTARGVALNIRFRTSSGDVELRDVTVAPRSLFRTSSGDYDLVDTEVGEDVEMRTSSGDIDLRGVTAASGFDITTSSGDVFAENSSGLSELESSSGDIRVTAHRLDGPSRFSSSSGDVTVKLDAVPGYDVEASSASGDVSLDVEALPEAFTLIVTKRVDRGRITTPFTTYTTTRTFDWGRNRYEERVVQQGTGGPTIRLRTASGSIELAVPSSPDGRSR